MRIYNNLAADNSHRTYNMNSTYAQKSLEKLSSGLRINRAGDDAAGVAISEKMRGQIRGLTQAQRNAQEAISMIQTAEGAAAAVHDMLQRGRELSVQAANGTLTDSDRSSVNDEVKQILSQINNVANNTEFNTIKMLNKGSFSGVSQSVIDDLQAKVPLWIDDALSNISTNLGITFPALRDMTVKFYQNPSETRAAYMATSDGGATLELGLNLSKLLDGSNQIPAGASGGQFDTVIAHEIVHALQFTAMSSIIGGGITNDEMWFVEGLATTIQGGNGFLSTMSPRSDATVSLSSWLI